MFESLSRSWEFTKLSYGMLRAHKYLMLYPVISTSATLLVLLSFAGPLWFSGQMEIWWEAAGDEMTQSQQFWSALTTFLFYFCNYFVIVFFNCALVASVMQIMDEGESSLGFGLSFAMKRLHSIFGWALISAVVGMLLKALERHRKIGQIVASLLGSAWTALTYFVVPVLVTDGVGPIEAFKRSTRTLKSTWGTALMGNFSMGTMAFLIMLPVFLLAALLIGTAVSSGSQFLLAVAIVLSVFAVVVAITATSTADGIFKAYLYAYATGRSLPEDVDARRFEDAFGSR